MASANPEQTWVNGRFAPEEQPPHATGREGAERLCRHELPCVLSWPRALLSGSFRRRPRRREFVAVTACSSLAHGCPAIATNATGRSPSSRARRLASSKGGAHELSGNATALVPQGRCHYFINLTLEPMAMIWVYAGDQPDRIIMEESYCHPEEAKEQANLRSDSARKPG